jgi:hypothetical protein
MRTGAAGGRARSLPGHRLLAAGRNGGVTGR